MEPLADYALQKVTAAEQLTSSTLQTMEPSGMSPTGLTLPMERVAFLPQ